MSKPHTRAQLRNHLQVVEQQTAHTIDGLASMEKDARAICQGELSEFRRIRLVSAFLAIRWSDQPTGADRLTSEVLCLLTLSRHGTVACGPFIASNAVTAVSSFWTNRLFFEPEGFGLEAVVDAVSAVIGDIAIPPAGDKPPALDAAELFDFADQEPFVREETFAMGLSSPADETIRDNPLVNARIVELLRDSRLFQEAARLVRVRPLARWVVRVLNAHRIEQMTAELEHECAHARQRLAEGKRLEITPAREQELSRRRGGSNKESWAVQMKTTHPEWTHERVARELKISLRQLYRYAKYMEACDATKADGMARRQKGRRNNDRSIEAIG